MPARSKAELRFLFAKDKKLGQKFARETPNISALPEKVSKAKAVAKGLGKA